MANDTSQVSQKKTQLSTQIMWLRPSRHRGTAPRIPIIEPHVTDSEDNNGPEQRWWWEKQISSKLGNNSFRLAIMIATVACCTAMLLWLCVTVPGSSFIIDKVVGSAPPHESLHHWFSNFISPRSTASHPASQLRNNRGSLPAIESVGRQSARRETTNHTV